MRRLTRAWAFGLIYTLFVILFGAVVRITGSGAGCGQHWPTCHGEVAHLPQSIETAIELTHRVTSGLSLLLVLGLAVWTYRTHTRGHLARRAALWSCVFMVSESLVGAALVLLALVGKNDSWQRAAVMAVHLVNTSLLTCAMAAATFTVGRHAPRLHPAGLGARRALVCLGVVLVVSGAGAVTALGDTVYPVAAQSPVEVALQSADALSSFLERVRGLHPILALLGGFFLLSSVEHFRPGLARTSVIGLTVAQLLAGVLNVWLSAPGWMQVIHLALANGLWLALVAVFLQEALTEGEVSALDPRKVLDSPGEPGTVGS